MGSAAAAPRARLDRLLAQGDPDELCSEQALTAIDAVLASLDWQALERTDQTDAWECVLLIVEVHWQRSRLLSRDSQVAELRRGADVIAAAYSISPGGMSEDLRLRFQAIRQADAGISRVWNELGLRVLEYSEQSGSAQGAGQAADLFKRAIDAAPPGDPHLATYASNAGAAQSCRFECTGEREALDEALAAYRRALDLGSPRRPEYPAFQANLGAALSQRFELYGADADLAAAIDAQRAALLATPAGHPDRPMYLGNLGGSLTSRFERTGDLAALAEAIDVLRSAAAATAGPDEHSEGLTNLGWALLRYFEQTADTDALSAAVGALIQALGALPSDHPDLPAKLSNLAGACVRMYDRTGNVAALDIAAGALNEALRFPHRHRAEHLGNLGAVQQRRHDHTGDPSAIGAAIVAYRAALAITAPEDPARSGRLSSLGSALMKQHEALGDPDDLDLGIASLIAAVQAAPADDPDLCRLLSNYGDALSARFTVRHQTADLEAALAAYQSAAAVVAAPALARARAALRRGRLAASADLRHEAAIGGYADAVGLVSLVAWPGLGRADQERLLREFSGLASEAAACAIARGQAGLAVELLEQGRGVLIGQAMDSRTSDRALADRHPDHARRLLRLHQLVDRPPSGTADQQPADRAAHYGALARQRTELIAEIRALPGFDGFLLPPDFTALQAIAARGPVVVINVSSYRCDALIVTTAGVKVVGLPEVTSERVERAARAHLKLVSAVRAFPELPRARQETLSKTLREILGWLWDAIGAPVLRELGFEHRDKDWPRLWWCPTGILGLLPLHAAQRYDPVRLVDTGILDRVIFSYTPTIRALIGKQRPISAESGAGELLAVVMSQTPGLPSLPGADHEIDSVLAELPARPTVLRTFDATTDAVLAALAEHRWVHYVGHSSQYLRNPSQASLFMHDGRLTVLAIAQLRLTDAEFAFLSSCESGLAGSGLPDEVINLASALQIAGFRNVISTLWSIGDQGAIDIARAVYAELGQLDRPARASPAKALHLALRGLRNTRPQISLAAYCHAGG